MTIDLTKSGGVNLLVRARIDQAGGNQSARQSGQVKPVQSPQTRDADPAENQVFLSSEARAAGGVQEKTGASGLSSERLQEVLKRLTSGYYDNQQVRDGVARKLHDQWDGPSSMAGYPSSGSERGEVCGRGR